MVLVPLADVWMCFALFLPNHQLIILLNNNSLSRTTTYPSFSFTLLCWRCRTIFEFIGGCSPFCVCCSVSPLLTIYGQWITTFFFVKFEFKMIFSQSHICLIFLSKIIHSPFFYFIFVHVPPWHSLLKLM